MAKGDKDDKVETKDTIKFITSRSVDEYIGSLVQEPDTGFPDPSSIELYEPFTNPFEPPSWCNQELYVYAWVDPHDQVQMDRALKTDHWQMVKLINHPNAKDSDFRTHGAVERRGMILIYRPVELERRLRLLNEQRHHSLMSSQLETRVGDKYEKTAQVGESVSSDGFRPYVGEMAGAPVEKAEDMVSKTGGEE